MAIYRGFTHQKWWFSIVVLVYQRVYVVIHDVVYMYILCDYTILYIYHLVMTFTVSPWKDPPFGIDKPSISIRAIEKNHGYVTNNQRVYHNQSTGCPWMAQLDGRNHGWSSCHPWKLPIHFCRSHHVQTICVFLHGGWFFTQNKQLYIYIISYPIIYPGPISHSLPMF